MKMRKQRQQLIETVREMNRLGINQGMAGNASLRVEGGYLITPSAVAYDDLAPEDIILAHWDGGFESANDLRKPSSEWRFHRDILSKRPEFNAVIHTHGRAAMTIACQRRDIPPFHYMVALAGGNTIRCSGYATFGTQALSDHALKAMKGRKACLLANHGLLAAGNDLASALALAVEVETLSDTYWRTLQLGDPVLLSDDEMAEVLAKFEGGYGGDK